MSSFRAVREYSVGLFKLLPGISVFDFEKNGLEASLNHDLREGCEVSTSEPERQPPTIAWLLRIRPYKQGNHGFPNVNGSVPSLGAGTLIWCEGCALDGGAKKIID
jgi:hypothetical protein